MTSKLHYTAFLDANILYSAAIRDIFIELALADMYRAKWSDNVHSEWLEAVLRNRPDIDRAKLERTRDLMNLAVPNASVTGYEHLIEHIPLEQDPKDRHVIAAAIVGNCDGIVTYNTAHFPKEAVIEFSLEVQHPDGFLATLLHREHRVFCAAVRSARVQKRKPPYTVEQHLSNLTARGLVDTVAELRQYSHLLE